VRSSHPNGLYFCPRIMQLKRFNKILEAVEVRVQQEVSALLGADFILIGRLREPVSKLQAFERLKGKQVCARMDISGESDGRGCLLVGIKDAIRLGGTLIMLPEAELEEVIGREEYSEELADSYGEIANIVAGAFTCDFEELYPSSCRFVRKEQEILVPAKVDADSDQPVANQMFLMMSSAMALDGRQLGELVMLLPAETFALELEEQGAVAGPLPPEPAVVAASPAAAVPSPTQPAAPAAPPAPAAKGKVDPERQKKKIDQLLEECRARMESEVSALLSVDVSLGDLDNRLCSKEEFFTDTVSGRQILTRMAVVGAAEETAYLVVGIREAIYLGGVLIMLPPSELENVASAMEFGEDSRDAFSEVTNIIAGVYTAVFEEQYSQKLRFIKKEFEEVVAAKVTIASAAPIADGLYYLSAMSVTLQGRKLGQVQMLFPAELLDLAPAAPSAVAPDPSPVATAGAAPPPPTQPAPTPPLAGPSPQELAKQKKRLDAILEACRERVTEEVGAMLGAEVSLSNLENILCSKEDFFADQVSGKQIIANLDIVGELNGCAYLAVVLRDAIRIGGMLIMLPTQELDAVVSREEFGEDSRDAYGEIANIVAGAYTGIFEEQFSRKIRFIRGEVAEVVPAKVAVLADKPFPNGDYYLSKMDLAIDAVQLGRVSLLLPAALFGMDWLRQAEAAVVPPPGESPRTSLAGAAMAPPLPSHAAADGPPPEPDILLVGDDFIEAARIAAVLDSLGYVTRTLSFKDPLPAQFPGRLKAVYLVLREVSEQAFGMAIKISTSCSLPLIAAGPEWTRSRVIKAVRYGVGDILVTPASREEIADNLRNNLLQRAA
jgi:chemotaxis protein CheY-P-specific phosphatase CheC